MQRLALTFACGRYDRTEALRNGDVQPEGIDLQYIPIEASREVFDRFVGGDEFDCAELSISEYIRMVDANESRFVALPVFPSRVFRHGFIFINRNAGIRTPKDLEGKRIGTGLYTQTAAVFIRGQLHNEFGVDFSSVSWVQGAVEKPGAHGHPVTRPLLQPVNIVENESPYSLAELLARGDIDAIISARRPPGFGTNPDVVRLFPNYREVERASFLKTRIHPIMHLLAIRREVYERNPWVATSLYKAFVDAKNFALQLMGVSITQSTMFPWHSAAFEEVEEIMGGDPWPYGVEPNRPTLEAAIKFLHQQHMISRRLAVEELFPPTPDFRDENKPAVS